MNVVVIVPERKTSYSQGVSNCVMVGLEEIISE